MVTINNEKIELCYEKAEKLISSCKYSEAIETLNEVLKIYPSNTKFRKLKEAALPGYKLDFYKNLQSLNIDYLYYFSHLNNLESILRNGILSKNEVEKINLKYTSFAEETVQNRRHDIKIGLPDGSIGNLHDFVPLYFTSKTPTLYSRKDLQNNIFFLVIKSDIVLDDRIRFIFTDGNAASSFTTFHSNTDKFLKFLWR